MVLCLDSYHRATDQRNIILFLISILFDLSIVWLHFLCCSYLIKVCYLLCILSKFQQFVFCVCGVKIHKTHRLYAAKILACSTLFCIYYYPASTIKHCACLAYLCSCGSNHLCGFLTQTKTWPRKQMKAPLKGKCFSLNYLRLPLSQTFM